MPENKIQSLKETGFGGGTPSFGASAANFGWRRTLLYNLSILHRKHLHIPFPFMVCTRTKAALLGDAFRRNEIIFHISCQVFSPSNVGDFLISHTAAPFLATSHSDI